MPLITLWKHVVDTNKVLIQIPQIFQRQADLTFFKDFEPEKNMLFPSKSVRRDSPVSHDLGMTSLCCLCCAQLIGAGKTSTPYKITLPQNLQL